LFHVKHRRIVALPIFASCRVFHVEQLDALQGAV